MVEAQTLREGEEEGCRRRATWETGKSADEERRIVTAGGAWFFHICMTCGRGIEADYTPVLCPELVGSMRIVMSGHLQAVVSTPVLPFKNFLPFFHIPWESQAILLSPKDRANRRCGVLGMRLTCVTVTSDVITHQTSVLDICSCVRFRNAINGAHRKE